MGKPGGPTGFDREPEVGAEAGLEDVPEMWHVTLTLGGVPTDPVELRAALERLAEERPFLLSARFAEDRAEVGYWEQADCVEDAAALALRLWGEHRGTAGLPQWGVTGLEIVDRGTFQLRAVDRVSHQALVPAGGIRPF